MNKNEAVKPCPRRPLSAALFRRACRKSKTKRLFSFSRSRISSGFRAEEKNPYEWVTAPAALLLRRRLLLCVSAPEPRPASRLCCEREAAANQRTEIPPPLTSLSLSSLSHPPPLLEFSISFLHPDSPFLSHSDGFFIFFPSVSPRFILPLSFLLFTLLYLGCGNTR